MRAKIAVIYMITNLVTKNRYIGKTTMRKNKRWSDHKSNMKKHRHPNQFMQEDADRFGVDSFTYTELQTCKDHEAAYFEQVYIAKMGATYNIRLAGQKEVMPVGAD